MEASMYSENYWLLDDGRVWSGKRSGFVSADDREFIDWRTAGNTPSCAPDEEGNATEEGLAAALRFYGLPLGKLVTQEEVQQQFTAAIQMHLDSFAQTRNYDGIISAATYATSTIPKFAAEGQYAVKVRDATWATGYAIMDAVLSGQRPMPTIEDVIAELPSLVWPEGAERDGQSAS